MTLAFIIHIPLIFLLAFLLYKKFRESPLANFFWTGLSIKVASGIALGLLYIYYYTYGGDTFVIQNYSVKLTDILFHNPSEYFNIFFYNEFSEGSKKIIDIYFETRVIFFIKIISLLNIITLKNYWINSAYLSLFSFFGFFYLANTLIKIFKLTKGPVVVAFLFFPSLVFWTSGVLKESLVIASICLIIAYYLQYIYDQRKIKIHEVLILFLLLYCCWKIKFFYILILLPVLFSNYMVILLSNKFPLLKKSFYGCLSFLIIFGFLIIGAFVILPIDALVQTLYDNYYIILRDSKAWGKFAYEFENFNPEISSLLIHTPKALVIGLFRPFVWETNAILALVSGVENLIIMILCIGKMIGSFKSPIKISHETMALLTFVFITAILMAFIAPNWGTLVRYKTGFMPFWILFLSINNPIFRYFDKLITKLIPSH